MASLIGDPFELVDLPVADAIAGLGQDYVAVVNDPPWSALAATVPPPVRVVVAGSMELAALEAMAGEPDDGAVVVGLGGGTALDTAKFLAWTTGRPLLQIPSITSVDASFTVTVGVRVDGRVRYLGRIRPQAVVLDVDLIRGAPGHLNRAGIGDVLSCHTGLWDWRAAAAAGHGPPWRDDLAALATTLLAELEDAADDVEAVSADGVRWLASAYRRVGAACAEAGHSRFEEGSEHFWAYAYEHDTGAHQVHGELIAFAVVALAHVQGNEPAWALDLVRRCGTRAHPVDLGITRDQFVEALVGLRDHARSEALDVGVADLRDLTVSGADAAWAFAQQLPRVAPGARSAAGSRRGRR